MKVLIRPKKLSGKIDVVPSKSYSHRAIIAASLADGVSVIKNVMFSRVCGFWVFPIHQNNSYIGIKSGVFLLDPAGMFNRELITRCTDAGGKF